MRDCKTFMVCAVILIAAMYVISIGPASASENGDISAIYEACEAETDGGTSGVEIATISSPRAKVDWITNNRCGIRYEPWLHAVIGKEINEQETAEEVPPNVEKTCGVYTGETVHEIRAENAAEVVPVQESAEVETVPCIPETSETAKVCEVYGLSDVQLLLKASLTEAGIEWFWPYACAQMMQESGGNPYAVSPDGKDHGLFQFRAQFWTEPESIYDVDAQIRVYVSRVAARINAGLSIEEIISRHYTSDYITDIAWDYVNAVLQWVR